MTNNKKELLVSEEEYRALLRVQLAAETMLEADPVFRELAETQLQAYVDEYHRVLEKETT